MKVPVILVAAAVLTATAAAAGPAMKHTTAGTSAAKSSLLLLSDFGKGWTQKANPNATSGLTLSCKGYVPSGAGIVETGGAASPSYAASSVGPFVYQQTSVFATSAQAAALYRRAVQPGLIACVVQSAELLAVQGVKVTIVSKGPIPVTKTTKLTAGYRVVANLSSSKVNYKRKLYFDVIVISKGNAVSAVTMTSLVAPVPSNVEQAFAALISRRIGLPTA